MRHQFLLLLEREKRLPHRVRVCKLGLIENRGSPLDEELAAVRHDALHDSDPQPHRPGEVLIETRAFLIELVEHLRADRLELLPAELGGEISASCRQLVSESTVALSR
jgi:hypothetical protein